MIEAKNMLIGAIASENSLTGILNKAIKYIEPLNQEKEVTPSKEIQEITPDENYTGLSKVTVKPYEAVVTKKIISANGTYKASDEELDGYSEVEVSVPSGDNISDYFETTIKKSNSSSFTSNYLIKQIPTIKIEENVTSLYYAFANKIIREITLTGSTSNVTDMSYMFFQANISSIPQMDTSNVTNMADAFGNCTNLTQIPLLNSRKLINISYIVEYDNKLTYLGGFENLGQAYGTTTTANYRNYGLNLSSSSNLTHDSLMNVINNLYDIKTKGCNTQQLIIGSTNVAKLTAEEIAIATNKGWTVS